MKSKVRPTPNIMKTRLHSIYGSRSCLALGVVLALSMQTNAGAAGPLVQSATPVLSMEHVRVAFSGSVDPASATNLANYSFTAGPVTLNRATLITSSVVELYTSDQTPSSAHTLQISGVLDTNSVSMTTTQLNFTTPALTISPLRYDAGTTNTQPDGPSSPASAQGGYWVANPLIAGQTVGPVTNDNSTGFNAWNIDDTATASGNPNYTMSIDTNSVNVGITNGWRAVLCSRVVTNYASTATDHYLYYYQAGVRFGVAWGVTSGGFLFVNPLGGANYNLTTNWSSYHTNMMVYNPSSKKVSVYFDGQLIVDNYAGQNLAGNGVFTFGDANSAAKGSMNYNLVQLDVVGVTQPVVLRNPASITVAIGQQAAFTAAFTPFVNSYQWLSNGVIIAGATKTNYTTGILTASANGAQYKCRALSALGNVETTPATLTVNDPAPLVTSVTPILTLEHVRIAFSTSVDPTAATSLANYSFTAGAVTVNNATLIAPSVVELFTSDQPPGSAHILQISGIFANGGATIMTSTQLNFTTPNLTISPLRYDAGTTVTQPSGPLDPASAGGGYWPAGISTQPGMTVAPVSDDNGTGFNAWQVSDVNGTASGGTITYTMPIDQASLNLARTNGWRVVVHSRLADNSGSATADQIVIYTDSATGLRYGPWLGVDASLNLFVSMLGGSTYTLTSDLFSYHTHMMVYDPATQYVSYYFDGRLIVANYTGQASAGRGLAFGCASSPGKGVMNYNLVQLDVVAATLPVVTLNPRSTTNAVGQTVTFTAGFTPFVDAFQWLSNGVIIAGAASTNVYTTPIIGLDYSGSQYSCRALSSLGNVETAVATLTVTDQTNPPAISSAKGSLLRDRFTLTFSEPIMQTDATNIANYTWDNVGVTNVSARLVDPVTVELRAGPFSTGINYTVRVSNIRNLSNVPITPNSPATVIFESLSPLARYDAGDTNSAPSGPPDPTTPAGGNWSVTSWSDANLTVTAVTNDTDTGLNAWQVRDASSLYTYANYTLMIATNLQDNARASGWVLTVRGRMPELFGAAVAQFALYSDYNANRFSLNFNVDANNDLIVGVNAGYYTVTSDGSGLNYHLHQVVYDPASATASYYFDGTLILRGFPANIISNPSMLWGAASGLGEGTMNYNLVDLSTPDAPFLSIGISSNNALVSYHGVLEAATQVGTPATWTAVGTNLNSGASVYSTPLTGQQYFRARFAQ